VKLKSCRVGCVFGVLFGNVEKNAWARRLARKHRLYSNLSAEKDKNIRNGYPIDKDRIGTGYKTKNFNNRFFLTPKI